MPTVLNEIPLQFQLFTACFHSLLFEIHILCFTHNGKRTKRFSSYSLHLNDRSLPIRSNFSWEGEKRWKTENEGEESREIKWRSREKWRKEFCVWLIINSCTVNTKSLAFRFVLLAFDNNGCVTEFLPNDRTKQPHKYTPAHTQLYIYKPSWWRRHTSRLDFVNYLLLYAIVYDFLSFNMYDCVCICMWMCVC